MERLLVCQQYAGLYGGNALVKSQASGNYPSSPPTEWTSHQAT